MTKLDRLVKRARRLGLEREAAAVLEAYLAEPNHERAYRDFHWGNPPDADIEAKLEPLPRSVWQLGDVIEITYETDKGGELAWWHHEFDDPPALVASSKRQLIIAPGSWRVTPRGIVG